MRGRATRPRGAARDMHGFIIAAARRGRRALPFHARVSGRPAPLWQVSVIVHSEAEDAATALLELTFGQPASVYSPVDTATSVVSVLYPDKPVPTAVRRQIRNILGRIRAAGLRTGPGTVRIRRLAARDWSESWKRHFPPIEIGRRLSIWPSWLRRRARPGRAVVRLDPGLSFGTGQHPTTIFCLRHLATHRPAVGKASFWDIGTGSGILSIAAAKLGYGPIWAIDADPAAVRIARQNAQRNRVQVRFAWRPLETLPRLAKQRYAVICANLSADILLAESERILARLSPGGHLVLAGITSRQFAAIQRQYEHAGCRLIAERQERGWRSGWFLRARGGADRNRLRPGAGVRADCFVTVQVR